MIINTGSPVSPKVTVEINGVEVNYVSISSIVLELDENKHDVLTIHMAGIPPRAITDYIDAAVRATITMGQGRRTEFCGYVLYVEPESSSGSSFVNSSPFQMAKIVCFGASVNMKGVRTRVWEQPSAKRIAIQMAQEHGFSVDVVDDEFYLPRMVQAKQSDWEFFTNFCKEYGYSMSVNGTHMRVWDPFKAIGRRPSFESLIVPLHSHTPRPGNIIKFNGSFGFLTPGGSSYNYYSDSFDNTGVIVRSHNFDTDVSRSWSGASYQTRYSSELTNSSVSVIESERRIRASMKDNLPFKASVDVYSAIGTVPGGIVEVEGYGANFEGLWYVSCVRHVIGGSECVTTLSLSRDFNTTNNFVIPPVELPELPPDPRLINGSWKATVEKATVYV